MPLLPHFLCCLSPPKPHSPPQHPALTTLSPAFLLSCPLPLSVTHLLPLGSICCFNPSSQPSHPASAPRWTYQNSGFQLFPRRGWQQKPPWGCLPGAVLCWKQPPAHVGWGLVTDFCLNVHLDALGAGSLPGPAQGQLFICATAEGGRGWHAVALSCCWHLELHSLTASPVGGWNCGQTRPLHPNWCQVAAQIHWVIIIEESGCCVSGKASVRGHKD